MAAAQSRRAGDASSRDFTWYSSEVAPEDVVRYGEAYWSDFHCLAFGANADSSWGSRREKMRLNFLSIAPAAVRSRCARAAVDHDRW